MKDLLKAIQAFLKSESGANGGEYALLAGCVGIAFIVGASAVGLSLHSFMDTSNRMNALGTKDCSSSAGLPRGAGGGRSQTATTGTGTGGSANTSGTGTTSGSGTGTTSGS